MQLKDASVLAVDDERELAEVFAIWLQSLGCRRVRTAFDGDAALELMKTETFDLLISDMWMPGMDGLGLVERMEKLGKPMPSVIFLSGSSPREWSETGGLEGNAFLSKPLRLDDLKAAMECALEKVAGTPAQASTLES